MAKKALIAMSGGVDSSVAAYLMKEAGYECMGATMRLYKGVADKGDINTSYSEETVKAGTGDGAKETVKAGTGDGAKETVKAGTGDGTDDAKRAAKKMGMPFYIFDFEEEFKRQVIDRFSKVYESGGTPNPCIYCNKFIKFDRFFKEAERLCCDYVVTGHYARIEMENGRYILKRALDKSKDQSYVLYSMTQKNLAHTLFPLGDLSKSAAKLISKEHGLVDERKPESQDICFVMDGDYGKFLKEYTKKDYPSGDFVDLEGNVLGKHKGIINYTIGQRKGLGISAEHPYYVLNIDAKNNRVVLGENKDLFSNTLTAGEFNWISFENPPKSFRAKAKIRYRHEPAWALVEAGEDGTVKITFDSPQRAITKGQAVVLYDEDTVLGGGIITA